MRTKQKLILMLLALFTSIGAWADVTMPTLTTDPSNPVYYTIKNFRSNKYASYAGPSTQLAQVSDANYRTLWYFVENGEGVSIVPAADPTVKLATNSSATADGAVWYIKENPYNSGYFCISLKNDLSNSCWDDNASHTGVGYWRPASGDYAGTSWVIEASSVTFETRKAAITSVIERLPDVLKPAAKMTAYTNATTDAQLISAVADFSANVTFKCRSNNYLVVGKSKGAHVASPSNNEEIIQLVSVGDGSFFLKGYMSCKYMADVAENTAILTEANANTPYYIQALGDYAVARPTKYADNGRQYIHNGGTGCVGWGTGAVNSQYTIEEVTLPDGYVTVTYNVELDGNIVATETLRQASGNAAVVPSALQRDFVTYSYDPATIPANDATITATATVSGLPFTVSTDYANANWYYLHGHASHNDTYISTNGSATVWGTGKTATDAYKWAFIGNPITGIKVINKASGNGSYLMATDPATMGSTAKAWTLKQQTNTGWNSGANGFGLYDETRTYYLNTQDATLKYWSYFDQGSTFWVQEIPEVTVTFNLEVNSEVVNTIELNVPEGETVSVPAALTANYSPLAYDITGTEDVPVGESDKTVTVTATLKAGIVTDLSGLSNDKAYKLTTARGDLYIKSDHLASNHNDNAGATAGSFAILNFEGNYYLYCTESSKFVQRDGSLSSTVTSDVVSIGLTPQSTKHLYLMTIGGNGVNVTNTNDNYELVINSWTTPDQGNQYVICEVGEFNSTDALAALDDFFNGPTAFDNAIAALKAIPFGTGLNEYSFTGAYASYTVDNITALESAGYSPANLATAQGMLANYTINLPTAGFYRIKAGVSGKYITGTPSSYNSFLSLSETPDNTTIIYYDGAKLLNYSNGLYSAYTSAQADAGGAGDSYTFAGSANRVGYYTIYSTTSSGYMYDSGNTEGRGCVDRQGSLGGNNTDWTLEEVTELPVNITSIDGHGYASFYTPVGISSLPSGVKAYIATLTTDRVQFSEITSIPAGTAVVLYMPTCAESITKELPIGTASASTDGNVLRGNEATVALGEQEVLTMQSVNGDLGFYKFNGTNLAGFKAFINISDIPAGIKGFSFDFEDSADGIETIQNAETNAHMNVYDLQGRKVNANGKLPKGIYIENGKKVLK